MGTTTRGWGQVKPAGDNDRRDGIGTPLLRADARTARPQATSAREVPLRCPSYPGRVQLQEIVTRTDQRPLFAHRPPPPPQELAKSPSVLDLPEGRFHDRFPPGIQGAAPQRRQRPRHALLETQAGGRPPARRRRPRLAVLAPPRGDERLNALRLQGHDIGLRPVAG